MPTQRRVLVLNIKVGGEQGGPQSIAITHGGESQESSGTREEDI